MKKNNLFDTMKKCIILYNPHSGKGINKQKLTKITNLLTKNQYEYQLIQSEYQGHIEKIIQELPKVDVVLSIGGDGTFNEAMSGNAKRKQPLILGHIPNGTTNDIGYMLGLKNNILENVQLLLNGYVRWIDTCYVNQKLFTYAAGIGKFMAISYNTPRRLKKKIGYAAYLVEGLKDLLGENLNPYNITYTVNNQTEKVKCSFLLISNSNRVAGIKKLHQNIKLNDQQFEVLICKINKKEELIKKMMLLPTVNEISKIPGFVTFKTNKIKVKFEDDSLKTWTVDGEVYSEKNDVFNIEIGKSLPILVPKTSSDNIFIKAEIRGIK